MAIVTISRIQHRKGLQEQLPQLAAAELGWAMNSRRLFIGNGLIVDGAPETGNTEILTEYSQVLDLANQYTYKNEDAGYTPTTGNNSSQYNALVYHNGFYIAVGSYGSIIYSTNGTDWQNTVSGTINSLFGVAYGAGRYVAVGGNGTIINSTSGVAWNEVVANSYDTLTSVIYAGGQFVAITVGGSALTSTDGITWVTNSTGTTDKLNSIAYGNSTYVAVGSNGRVVYSTDAITWTRTTVGYQFDLNTIMYSVDGFVASGEKTKTFYSTNGITWNRSRVDAFIGTVTDETPTTYFLTSWGHVYKYSNGNYEYASKVSGDTDFTNFYYAAAVVGVGDLFVALTESGKIYTSGNAYNWTLRNSGVTTPLYGVYYDAVSTVNQFVVTGASGVILTSPDGITWTDYSISGLTTALYDATVHIIDNTPPTSDIYTWVVVGESGIIYTSPDAHTWTSRTSGTLRTLRSVINVNTSSNLYTVVAAGDNGTIISSTNTTSWTTKLNGIAVGLDASNISIGNLNSIRYYNWTLATVSYHHYIATGNDGLLLTSTDLQNWYQQASNTSGDIIESTINNNVFFVAGDGGLMTSRSTDIITWATSSLIYGLNQTVPDIFGSTYSGTYNLLVGQFGLVFKSTGKEYFQNIENLNYDARAIVSGANKVVATGATGLVANSIYGGNDVDDPWVRYSYNFNSTVTRRSMQRKLDDFVSVKDFGAKGDGVTDDTMAINLALHELYCRTLNPTARKTLYFPAGHYIVSNSINVPSYATLVGEGMDNTIIEQTRPVHTSPVVTWVMYTADSLQQIQSQIGLNDAELPVNITIDHMTLISNSDGIVVDKAKRVTIDNVRFQAPKTGVTQVDDPILGYPAVGANLRGTIMAPIEDLHFKDCYFTGYNIGIYASTGQYVTSSTAHHCSFYDMYQGIQLALYGGDIKQFTVSSSHFDHIYDSGVAVNNATNFVSTFNFYKDVANHNLGDTVPSAIVIYFGASCRGSASIGDEFARSDISNKLVHRVSESDTTVDWQFSTGLRLGYLQQNMGREDVIVNNSIDVPILINIDEADTETLGFEMLYTISRGGSVRTGIFKVVTDGVSVYNYDDDSTETADVGVILGFDGTYVTYTSTNTGSSGTIHYAIRYMELH
jgi:hypothetical protein